MSDLPPFARLMHIGAEEATGPLELSEAEQATLDADLEAIRRAQADAAVSAHDYMVWR